MRTVTWSLASAGLAGPPSAEAPAAGATVPADAGAADADRPARPAAPGWPGEPWLPRAAVPAADLVAAAAVSSVTCDPSAGRAAQGPAKGKGRADARAALLNGARSALLGLPEDLRDLVDLRQQLVRGGHVGAALGAACPGQLGGLVEQLVQLRVLLEVRRLEVVGPQHPQVVLDEVRALFLDLDGAGAEGRVVVALVLLGDRADGLGLDP